MLRAFAYSEGPAGPAHTLSRLDQVTQGVSAVPLITALHGVLRCCDITLSSVGHPHPLLISASGRPSYLHSPLPPDPPLCAAPDTARNNWNHLLRIGETLVFYTDGLVEAPGMDISDGLHHLEVPLSPLVPAFLPSPGTPEDGIAVIALRADDGSEGRRYRSCMPHGIAPPDQGRSASPGIHQPPRANTRVCSFRHTPPTFKSVD